MTREAKVGLLLGLAFIVAIAVVLRGVHQEGPALTQELGVLPRDTPDEAVEPIGDRVEQLLTPVRQRAHFTPATTVEETVAQNDRVRQRVVVPLAGTVVLQENGERGNGAMSLYGGTVRHEQELPGRKTPPTASSALESVAESTTLEPLIEAARIDAFAPRGPRRNGKKPQHIYVVKQGDSLSSIAKQVYGEVEGNRRVHSTRIYQANKEQMRSMDFLSVGQRLQIPALPEQPQELQIAPAKARQRTYEVKNGDSLWKIAARVLGDGGRYHEIAKLNADTLSDEDSLQVGMRLRIP